MALPFHDADVVSVDAAPVAVEEQDDRQTDGRFGCRYHNDKEAEHLAGQPGRREEFVERHKIDVGGVKHQLERHKNTDRVPPRYHAK